MWGYAFEYISVFELRVDMRLNISVCELRVDMRLNIYLCVSCAWICV